MDYAWSCNECAVFCAHGLLKSTHGKYLYFIFLEDFGTWSNKANFYSTWHNDELSPFSRAIS